jgi:hypothetical protein
MASAFDPCRPFVTQIEGTLSGEYEGIARGGIIEGTDITTRMPCFQWYQTAHGADSRVSVDE